MFTFDDDDLVDCLAGGLLMEFGIGPDTYAILGPDPVPMSWVPFAKGLAQRLREDGVVNGAT